LPRHLLLIVAVWVVALAPALCTAGVLAHECGCVDESPCDHETDCDMDPCADQILRRDDVPGGPAAEVGPAAPSMAPSMAPDTAGLVPARADLHHAAAPGPDPVPPLGASHLSDLPLLS
jgi:hypothetical protein